MIFFCKKKITKQLKILKVKDIKKLLKFRAVLYTLFSKTKNKKIYLCLSVLRDNHCSIYMHNYTNINVHIKKESQHKMYKWVRQLVTKLTAGFFYNAVFSVNQSTWNNHFQSFPSLKKNKAMVVRCSTKFTSQALMSSYSG